MAEKAPTKEYTVQLASGETTVMLSDDDASAERFGVVKGVVSKAAKPANKQATPAVAKPPLENK